MDNWEKEVAKMMQEQEMFLQSKQKPAAKVIRTSTIQETKNDFPSEPPALEEDSDKPMDPPKVPVMGGIVEREVDGVKVVKQPIRLTAGGFPAITKLKPGKVSKFRERKNLSAAQAKLANDPLFKRSKIRGVDGEMEKQNIQKIQEMSIDEIRAAQEELKKLLPPKVIQRMKGISDDERVQKKAPVKIIQPTDAKVAPTKVVVPTELSQIKTEDQLIEQLTTLSEEDSKRAEWLLPLSEADRATTTPDSVRFDFDGNIVDHTKSEENIGLYHHGDEPSLAGYTIEELMMLVRSTVPNQRTIALDCLTNILKKRQNAYSKMLPEEVTHISPENVPKELAFALRSCLDEKNATVLDSAVAALHSYLVPTYELHAIDANFDLHLGIDLLPPVTHVHPTVASPGKKEVAEPMKLSSLSGMTRVDPVGNYQIEKGEQQTLELSDDQVLRVDPIDGMVRMHVLIRIRYILKTLKPQQRDTINALLEIIYVIATHSCRSAKAVMSCEGLTEFIREHFIESYSTDVYKTSGIVQPLVRALRIVRGLCQMSREIAQSLIEKGYIQSILGFIALRDNSPVIHELQVESLRVWRVCLSYSLSAESFSFVYPLFCGVGSNSVSGVQSISELWGESQLTAIYNVFTALAKTSDFVKLNHRQILLFIENALTSISKYENKDPDEKAMVMIAAALNMMVSVYRATQTLAPEIRESILQTNKLVSRLVFPVQCHSAESLNLYLSRIRLLITCSDTYEKSTWIEMKTSSIFTAMQVVFGYAGPQSSKRVIFPSELYSSRLLTHVQIHCLALCSVAMRNCSEYTKEVSPLFSRCTLLAKSIQLISRILPGDEPLFCQLFDAHLFSLETTKVLLSKRGLLENDDKLLLRLQQLAKVYSGLVLKDTTIAKTKWDGLSLFPCEAHSNLPLEKDWLLHPLSKLEASNATTTSVLGTTVWYLHLVETSLSDVDLGIPITWKLYHLLQVFFVENQVLFSEELSDYVSEMANFYVQRYLEQNESSFATDVWTILLTDQTSKERYKYQYLIEFIQTLLHQFTNVSYGNQSFSRCLSLFTRTEFPVEVRQVVWKLLNDARMANLLQSFSFPKAITDILFPFDSSPPILDELERIILDKRIVSQRNADSVPFAYGLAIHNLCNYIFRDTYCTESPSSTPPLSSPQAWARRQRLESLVSKCDELVLFDLFTYRYIPPAAESFPCWHHPRLRLVLHLRLEHASILQHPVQFSSHLLDGVQ